MKFAPGSGRLAAVPALLGCVGALGAAINGAVLLGLSSGIVGIGLAVAVLFFHRDPDRQIPPTGVLAPADGRVAVVREEDDGVRIGIYMGGRDIHVNRAPITGQLTAVEHEPGANKPAFSKESDRNERLRFVFEEYTAEMIAGAFARRTNAYVNSGERVSRGQRIGHISFSSRFDVVLPPAYDPEDVTVAEGTRVFAGETTIAPPETAIADETDAVSSRRE